MLPDGTNLDKLATAIAYHETHDCRKGSGLTHNNCFGIKDCYAGRCYGFKRYESKTESYKHFKELWKKGYNAFPDYYMAQKYSGGDRTNIWLSNVTSIYNSL